MMFCPQCGTATLSPDQRFCKTCGANVALVSQILNAPAANVFQPVPRGGGAAAPGGQPVLSPFGGDILANFQQSPLYQLMHRAGLGLMLGGAFFIPSCAIIGGVLDRQPELCALGVPVILLGVFLLLFARFALKKPDPPQVIVLQQSAAQPVASPEQTPFYAPPLQFPPEPVPVNTGAPPPSVTENTTRSLETPYRYKTQ